MARRVLAALLVVLFGAVLLAGCGSQSRPDEGAGSVAVQAEAQLRDRDFALAAGEAMPYEEWDRLSYADLKAKLESGALDANQVVVRRNWGEKGGYDMYSPMLGFALGKSEYARLLFDHGADPDVVLRTEWDREIKVVESASELPSIPLMHRLAAEGYVDMMKVLVEHGADIDIVDDTYQMTPFLFAGFSSYDRVSDGKYIRVLRFLAENGADVHAVDNNGENILGYLAQHCRHELLRYAVQDLGVDVNHKSNDDISALGVAAMLAPGSVSVLLDLGAEVDASALRLAVIW